MPARRPSGGRNQRAILNQHAAEAPPAAVLAAAPPAVLEICLRLLAKDRDERFPDAAALVVALEEARRELLASASGDLPLVVPTGEVGARPPLLACAGIDPPKFLARLAHDFRPHPGRRAGFRHSVDAPGSHRDCPSRWSGRSGRGRRCSGVSPRRPSGGPRRHRSEAWRCCPSRTPARRPTRRSLPTACKTTCSPRSAKSPACAWSAAPRCWPFGARAAAGRIREIGRALGVAFLVEGRVRRAASRVLVSVRLLDARDERLVWSERYDRTLADTLTLQGELAQEIAGALRSSLSPSERVAVATRPTDNADAYMLWLRARELERTADPSQARWQEAERLYAQAVALDPSFALAHAGLSSVRSRLGHWYEPTAARRALARAAAEEALRLQPRLGEARKALALCLYWGERDFEGAAREFLTAGELLPNDPDVPFNLAAIRRRGRAAGENPPPASSGRSSSTRARRSSSPSCR